MLKINDFIKQLENEIKSSTDEVEKNKALARLQEVAKTYIGEDKVISSYEIEGGMKNRPEERKIMSGFIGLDKILDGFRYRQLVVLSAATKSGKTSMAIELTLNLKEYNPLWFPFEEGAEDLIIKFHDRKEKTPLFYTPKVMKGNTLEWIEKKIIEAKAKYNSQIIFIDHLHFIIEMSNNQRIDTQIGITMRKLKEIAKTWNVVIVLITHLKKTKMAEQPNLEDLRDSSFIAQEADTVLMLWREHKKENGKVVITNNVNVSVQANRRNGKTGNVEFVFKDGRFFEKEWERTEEEQDIINSEEEANKIF